MMLNTENKREKDEPREMSCVAELEDHTKDLGKSLKDLKL